MLTADLTVRMKMRQITQKSTSWDSNSGKLSHKHAWRSERRRRPRCCRVMLLFISAKAGFTCLWGSSRNASKHLSLIYTDMYCRTHLMLSGCCSDLMLHRKAPEMKCGTARPDSSALWFSHCGQNSACKSSNILQARCSCLDTEHTYFTVRFLKESLAL